MSEPIVKYNNVTKYFDDLMVLDGIDFEIQPGEKVALVGPSGSGKTTFARLLMTLEEITDGTIEVEGDYLWHEEDSNGELKPASTEHLRKVRSNIGMVFQHFHLFPHMTVLENIIEAPVTVKGIDKKEAIKDGKEMLEKVGLSDKADTYPAQLSGGQKQRVAIARALVMKPKVLIFDEPTSALDPELVGEVLDVIKDIANQGETSMLLITHEMDFAREVADRIAFFDAGKIVEDGPPSEILYNPQAPRLKEFLERFMSTQASPE
ncbi:ectoine/hydroxyectoine ABC transporter ATP-binding protein EhuA [Alkalibacterium olivapovliticus]|uniref:Polar amino acid transport system ATP-binding protein n=1 Tax=Alkalibacterium olivapovliticus TaxID=99907 RepID=A0A2T0VZN2_9LACT|nr:ectoine/hydroxyectoine ABC transporter ATP-binding protein EhuA [Alkalibacterium olivapovliticus]PRY78022.1 polar amino acid transport system ATP-binding protein [Alkalibacterium olivapovliticus]